MDANHRIREASEIGIYSEVSGLRYPEKVGGVPGGLNQKIGSKQGSPPIIWEIPARFNGLSGRMKASRLH